MELENSRLYSTRTCAAFQVYYAKVFCFFASAGVASGLQVVKFWLFPSVCWGGRIGWTTSVLVFTALHLLSCLQLRFQCISHPKSNLLYCQTWDWWLILTQKEYIFSIMTGTDKFPKDSDSMPSAFKLISILSYKSHTCSFFVSCTELTIAISKLPCG